MTTAQKKLNLIYSQIREEIIASLWAAGSKLPNKTKLAQKFGGSLGTVSKAHALLGHEDFVERKALAGITVIYDTEESSAALRDPSGSLYSNFDGKKATGPLASRPDFQKC